MHLLRALLKEEQVKRGRLDIILEYLVNEIYQKYIHE